MHTYRHRQTSRAMAALGGLLFLWMIGVAVLVDGRVVLNVVLAVVSAVVVSTFIRLTTGVDRKAVHTAFTYGWPRRTIAVRDIEAHEIVRNKWYYGWGIRLVPGGAMFSLWGLDAVAITYRHKGKTKTFRIGTDDPAGLDAAITSALAARPATG